MKRSCHFKCGFTLVELLVVVVVIVTLMAITFRLSGIGSDSTARNKTINRMQRLENALSGYYAAYGSYPPVALHGSRDYRLDVNDFGIQDQSSGSSGGLGASGSGGIEWKRVEAACRSQPLGMAYPFVSEYAAKYAKKVAELYQQRANSSDSRYASYGTWHNGVLKQGFTVLDSDQVSILSGKKNEKSWSEAQIFKFGVMSYLLPRYLFMMGGTRSSMDSFYAEHSSWTENNKLPCRFENGRPYDSWSQFNKEARAEETKWKVPVLPSQAACARWIQNFKDSLAMLDYEKKVYGVHLKDDDQWTLGLSDSMELYSATSGGEGGPGSNTGGQLYLLDSVTMRDGWGSEFFYYSPPPHQNYRVWSAGSNGYTFPPWVDDKELEGIKKEPMQKDGKSTGLTIGECIADDITHMSN